MRLAGCGLSVGEDGAVEALDDAVDDRRGGVVVHLFLVGIDIEYLIKGKLQGLFFLVLNRDGLVIQEFVAVHCSHCLFFLVERPEAANDFDIGAGWLRVGSLLGSHDDLLKFEYIAGTCLKISRQGMRIACRSSLLLLGGLLRLLGLLGWLGLARLVLVLAFFIVVVSRLLLGTRSALFLFFLLGLVIVVRVGDHLVAVFVLVVEVLQLLESLEEQLGVVRLVGEGIVIAVDVLKIGEAFQLLNGI